MPIISLDIVPNILFTLDGRVSFINLVTSACIYIYNVYLIKCIPYQHQRPSVTSIRRVHCTVYTLCTLHISHIDYTYSAYSSNHSEVVQIPRYTALTLVITRFTAASVISFFHSSLPHATLLMMFS